MDIVSSIVSAIQLAVAAAPAVEDVIGKTKAWISSLFGAGVIDAATQNALHAHVDAIAAAALAGNEPPEFKVEPD